MADISETPADSVRLDVWLYSEAHLKYQAGFLTYRSLHRLPFSHLIWVMQWDHWAVFPVYSDRIVQDLHLVPSSDNNCGIVSPALDTAILNYTNNIIDLKREVVNPPFF